MLSRWIIAVETCALVAIAAFYGCRDSATLPVSYEVAAPLDLASQAEIERALDRRVSCRFDKIPLDKALQQLAHQVHIPIQINERALADATLSVATPILLDVGTVTLRSALNLMLRQMDLTWTIEHQVLHVTTPELASQVPIVKVYPVCDLVADCSNCGGRYSYQQLIDLITATIRPTTWEGSGPGPTAENRAAGVLVFEQSREAHDEIAALLTALRKTRDAQKIQPFRTTVLEPRVPMGQAGQQPPGQSRGGAPQSGSQPAADGQPATTPKQSGGAPAVNPGGGFY